MSIGVLVAPVARAQDRPMAKPPFAVGGFRYQHMPPNTHMNICEAAACTPGSQVSYILFAPSPPPSLERYKAQRKAISEALRKSRAAAGATVAFSTPKQSKDKLFTIFMVRRVETYPDGRRVVFLSQQLYSARFTADIISSSPSEEAAKKNLDLFMLPIMMTAVTKPSDQKER
jgi:hypothetical protein